MRRGELNGPGASRWQLVAFAMLGALACSKNQPAVARPDDLARRYQACWSAYGAGRWAEVAACHARDAAVEVAGLADTPNDAAGWLADVKQRGIVAPGDRGEPELVVVAQRTLIGVVRVTGTDDGQSVGVRLAEVVEYDARGKVTRNELYYDAAARTGAPSPAALRISIADDEIEAARANEATVGTLLEAWGDSRWDAVSALVTDDVVWTEAALDLRLDKAGLLAHLVAWHQGFSDLELDLNHTWFVGDFVIVRGLLAGENDGDCRPSASPAPATRSRCRCSPCSNCAAARSRLPSCSGSAPLSPLSSPARETHLRNGGVPPLFRPPTRNGLDGQVRVGNRQVLVT